MSAKQNNCDYSKMQKCNANTECEWISKPYTPEIYIF
jgi:hypothetical protein